MPYHCPFEGCDKKYHRDHRSSFIQHVAMNHRGNSTISEKYVCEVCGYAFKYEASLLNHMNRYHKGFRGKFSDFCELCGAGLPKHLF